LPDDLIYSFALVRRPSWRTQHLIYFGCALAYLAGLGCADEFDTTRRIPQRGSLGRELYTLACDRVGAQSLPEDVTGASYRGICHPDAKGAYASAVDDSILVALDPEAKARDGQRVPLAEQERRRAYHIARIERLGQRREELILALDAALPDLTIALKDVHHADVAHSCDPAGEGSLHAELGLILGRMVEIENDGTLPQLTRVSARIFENIAASSDAQAALARIDARQGYRSFEIALGAARSVLAYPRIPELSRALFGLLSSGGKAHPELAQFLSVLRQELRTAPDPVPLAVLEVAQDSKRSDWRWLSRPRGSLEFVSDVALAEDPVFDIGVATTGGRLITRRDRRAVAQLFRIAPPFVDQTGVDAKPDGLADLDPLGQFVTLDGALVPSPFFSPEAPDGPRDTMGRAISEDGKSIYDYLDTRRTALARLLHDVRPLFDPDPTRQAMLSLLGGLPVLMGERPQEPATRTYAADPARVKDWPLSSRQPVPLDLGTEPITLSYRAFDPRTSPIVDLVHGLGHTLADPAMDDVLALVKDLALDHPETFARLVGIALEIKAVADQHPEAKLPASSLLWDELLDVIVKMAQAPGVLDDLLLAFTYPNTVKLQSTFAAYTEYRDVLTYDRGDLNGTAYNLTRKARLPLGVPVDRSQPDVGDNRSVFQKFLQLLHDANGLGTCTKEGAVAHVRLRWNGIPVSMDYPSDRFLSSAVCAFLGSDAPYRLPLCGVLRLDNVARFLLDVALNRAVFDVRDDCLRKLMESPLTNLVGGVDAFLEDISGIDGFSMHPTVAGVSRLLYFDVAHDGLAGDTQNTKTHNFIRDIMDPVATMVCPPKPFKDPSDGQVINLRQCDSFAETMRGRNGGSLFPLEQNDFIQNVQALAAAFADHGQSLLFVELLDTLHRHWGSPRQPRDLCDPSLGKSHARWCSQDGAVSYEPLLVDVLRKTDLFQTLHDVLSTLRGMTVRHCDAQDPITHRCTKTSLRDGVTVLAEATRVLLDPSRNGGVRDRRGQTWAFRNDGTKNKQVTRLYLFIDALKAVDAAFSAWSGAFPDDTDRQGRWRSARSQLVDTFLAVDGKGAASRFRNPAIPKIVGLLVTTLQDQILARCPDRSSAAKCAWGRDDLSRHLADVVQGPLFAATVDLLDVVRRDPEAHTELSQLIRYLLDQTSGHEAEASTIAAAADLLQILGDDPNLVPIYRALSDVGGTPLVDEMGQVVRRPLLGAAVEVLARVFGRVDDAMGRELCAKEIDPNRVLAIVLERLVTPMGGSASSPIEVVMDVMADVNRQDPSSTAKLGPEDYENIAKEMSTFFLHKGRGLEQVYTVIRQATEPTAP
jgi:hypothetical protein